MGRRATAEQAVGQIGDVITALKLVQAALPTFLEQARLELQELTGGLPETVCRHCGEARRQHGSVSSSCRGFEGRGADFSGDPPTHYSDPTGEAVIHYRPPSDGSCRPVEDLERYQQVMADVARLIGSARRLLNQVPSVTLAVVDGRRPTDGRSAEEHAQRRFVRVLSGEPCLVGQDHEEQDRFGPGELRRGLCNRHRMAYSRWQLAAGPEVLGLEESERLVRWQAAVFGPPQAGEQTVEGPYRSNLREVA